MLTSPSRSKLVSELYERGVVTLLASWRHYATGSPGAAVIELPGAAAAVFPKAPERAVYNNALLERGLEPGARSAALEAMEATYDAAGVERYAAWVHEEDAAMVADLAARGYRFDTSTRAMGMELADLSVPRPRLDLGRADWGEHVRVGGVPAGLLAAMDPSAFHVLVAKLDGVPVATAIAYDHDGDCGLFNLGTMPKARRRGLGSAVTALILHDARDRGCSTASLQATPMAERIYAAIGFRDLGHFLEYVPGS